MIEYITLYLKKYRKRPIYNIIRNNQKELLKCLKKIKILLIYILEHVI